MLSFPKHKIPIIIISIVICASVYHYAWGRHVYTITAYCECPICVNVPEFRDGRFASGGNTYWGGVAVDKSIPFGTNVELIPHSPLDWLSVFHQLQGRRDFVAEDRGGKIKGKRVDLFIPDELGGHEVAKQWGVRKMRVKLDGILMK